MKTKLFIYSLLIMMISCQKEKENFHSEKTSEVSVAKGDSKNIPAQESSISDTHKELTLIENFRRFREAVYHGNRVVAKEYIDFPISGNGMEMEPYPIAQEKDFERSFNEIFPKEIITAMLKIKTEQLFATKKFETPEISDGKGGTYICYASITDNVLMIHINLNTKIKSNDTEFEYSESSAIYGFRINGNHLKLKSLVWAG